MEDECVQPLVHIIGRNHAPGGGGDGGDERHRLVRDALGPLPRLAIVNDDEVDEAAEQFVADQRPAGPQIAHGCCHASSLLLWGTCPPTPVRGTTPAGAGATGGA